MSVLFSHITLRTDNDETEFLIPGIPSTQDDLTDSDEYDEFMERLDSEQVVNVYGTAYVFGEGETDTASSDDIEDIAKRIAADDNFLKDECECIEEIDFSFLASPEEEESMDMGGA